MRSSPISGPSRRRRRRPRPPPDSNGEGERHDKGNAFLVDGLRGPRGAGGSLRSGAGRRPPAQRHHHVRGRQAMGGVTVSAKADGGTITTTVFTDEAGGYYFPALATGKYRVWAQALGFETAKGEIDLGAARRQNFSLKPMTDAERQVRQLPGDLMLAGLPEETPDDLRMKRLVRNNCTGCHTPSYVLQHRFDEAGWTAIIELMKRVNVGGVFQGEDRPPNPILDFNQKELAAYLARARGPGESGM